MTNKTSWNEFYSRISLISDCVLVILSNLNTRKQEQSLGAVKISQFSWIEENYFHVLVKLHLKKFDLWIDNNKP